LTFPVFARAQAAQMHPTEGEAALARATQRQGLLAVFIIPDERSAAVHRGHQLGSFLMFGPEEALSALGFAEVVCMRMAELRALVPNTPDGDPVLIVIDTAQAPMAMMRFDGPLPVPFERSLSPELQALAEPEGDPRFIPWRDAQDALQDQRVEEDIAAVTRVVLAAFAAPLAHASPSERSEALLRTQALLQLSVTGSVWAQENGCGVAVEEAPPSPGPRIIQLGELCGMGHVPERAERFLYFYSVLDASTRS
jgi:hypothetical protein